MPMKKSEPGAVAIWLAVARSFSLFHFFTFSLFHFFTLN
jgi:hypothetical protein